MIERSILQIALSHLHLNYLKYILSKMCYSPMMRRITLQTNPRKKKFFKIRLSSTSSILTRFATYTLLYLSIYILKVAEYLKTFKTNKKLNIFFHENTDFFKRTVFAYLLF